MLQIGRNGKKPEECKRIEKKYFENRPASKDCTTIKTQENKEIVFLPSSTISNGSSTFAGQWNISYNVTRMWCLQYQEVLCLAWGVSWPIHKLGQKQDCVLGLGNPVTSMVVFHFKGTLIVLGTSTCSNAGLIKIYNIQMTYFSRCRIVTNL